MRTEIKTIRIYTFQEANKELREKIRENMYISGFHDYVLEDRIKTLKSFADLFNAELDFSLSLVPDRGEYIKLNNLPENITSILAEFINNPKDCPLTGCCYDEDLRDSLIKNGISSKSLNAVFEDYIARIHNEYEYLLSDECIEETCDANGYEFTEDGQLY